ncbi:MAG: hypothetical protein JW943_14665 [Deltaproteobacteria bacterium]|nr:hypothetical protein [Deltaproteobacteria bacterium]
MGLRAIMDEAVLQLFEEKEQGEDAVFHPAEGDPIPCKVFIDFDVRLQPAGIEAQVWETGTVIEAPLSMLGRKPVRGETFTYDSTTYTVKRIADDDRFTFKAEVT